jgi:AcrR family transcriptional regulator
VNPGPAQPRPEPANPTATRAATARSGEGKERILLAALDEFAARGFDGASTTAIARRSGVTQPLIHYHFASKEGLWRATVDDLFSRLGQEFLEAIRRHPPTEANARTTLLALIREFVRF